MIPTEIFEKLNNNASSIAPIGGTIKFKLGEKTYFLDGTGSQNTFSTEDREADCTISMSEKNFQKLVEGKLNPMTAMMMGQIKIKGDMTLVMKLKDLLS